MAITDNEKKLLKEFYETNKALLSAVADCLRNDDELDENEKASLSTFSKVINKDYTKYSFDGKSNLSKRRLVLEIVKKYVNDHRDITYEDLKKVFPDELHGTYCVCKKHEDIKKNQERNYFVDDLIELSDTKVAVCNQWGIDNVVKVIDKAKELEYEIVLDK